METKTPECPRCGAQLSKVKDKDYYGCPNWLPKNQGCEGVIWFPESIRKSNYPNVLFSVKMGSKSNPGYFHQVKVYESGDVSCSCVGYEMKLNCSHILKMIEIIEKKLEQIKKKYGTRVSERQSIRK